MFFQRGQSNCPPERIANNGNLRKQMGACPVLTFNPGCGPLPKRSVCRNWFRAQRQWTTARDREDPMQTCLRCGKSADETVYGSCPGCFAPWNQPAGGPAPPAISTRPGSLPPLPGPPPNFGRMPQYGPLGAPPSLPTPSNLHQVTRPDRSADGMAWLTPILIGLGVTIGLWVRFSADPDPIASAPQAQPALEPQSAPAAQPIPPAATAPAVQPPTVYQPAGPGPEAPTPQYPQGFGRPYPQPDRSGPSYGRYHPRNPYGPGPGSPLPPELPPSELPPSEPHFQPRPRENPPTGTSDTQQQPQGVDTPAPTGDTPPPAPDTPTDPVNGK